MGRKTKWGNQRNSRGGTEWTPNLFASARTAAACLFPWFAYRFPCQVNKLRVTQSIATSPRRSERKERCNILWSNYDHWLHGCTLRVRKNGLDWRGKFTTNWDRL